MSKTGRLLIDCWRKNVRPIHENRFEIRKISRQILWRLVFRWRIGALVDSDCGQVFSSSQKPIVNVAEVKIFNRHLRNDFGQESQFTDLNIKSNQYLNRHYK